MVDVNSLKALLADIRENKFQNFEDEVTVIKLLNTKPFMIKNNVHFYGDRAVACRKNYDPDGKCVGCMLSGARLAKKVLFYGIHIKESARLKIFNAPVTVASSIINLIVEGEWVSLVEPTSELIVVKKVGTGIKTKYQVSVAKKKFTHEEDVSKLNLWESVDKPTIEEQIARLGLENADEILARL